MKKYTVISRCKNPDKYIDRLTKGLEETRARERENYSNWIKEKGQFFARYNDGESNGISKLSLKQVRKIRVGDGITAHSTVCGITKQGDGYNIRWTLEKIFVKPLEENDA